MVRSALKSLRSAFGQLHNFLLALFRTPTEPSNRDSTAAERAKAAKQVGDAMHVRGGLGGSTAGGFSGTSAADGLFGKSLADGHEKARKKTPPPRAR